LYGERREEYTGFWGGGTLRARGHLRDPGVDARIILRWISGSGRWGMVWIEVAQDRERWWTLVNAVMNLRVP